MNRYSPNSILVNLLLLLVALPGLSYGQPAKQLPYWRPYDMRGINVFETGKQDTVEYDGPDLRWGAAFTQQFQALDHENAADEVIVDGVNRNQLMEIGNGFNLATANLYLDALLAEGIRVNLITYLSSRHHPEAWVKGGFFQVDRLPMFKSDFLDNIMDYVTLRIGHFEINYGDAHLRRTDNGNALYNPLVGNYIMDAYTTEIGGEVYVQSNGFLGMLGMTDGEIQGNVTRPDDRSPSIYGKLGFDRQLQPDLRLRLTGSFYTTASSINNTLYGGDRAGSRYYLVMENTTATISSNFTSGRINPGLTDKVTALMLNPFVKFQGLELFGIIEQVKGRNASEQDERTWNQLGVEAVYRFLPGERLHVAARYNTVSGELAGSRADVSINRFQVGAGWFVTPNILVKAEYVTQSYNDFPSTDIRHEGEFKGFMLEGVIAF
jgi:hypothetical protein